jgi:hypothetical protein
MDKDRFLQDDFVGRATLDIEEVSSALLKGTPTASVCEALLRGPCSS